MSFQVGNREKLAGLTILCLVSIGATHWFLFMPRATSYRVAYDDYQTKRYELMRMASQQSKPEIEQYIKETQAMEDFIHTLARDLNLALEPKHFETGEKTVRQLQRDLLDVIDRVIDLRTTRTKIGLSFMGWRPNNVAPSFGTGWDIPSQLPPNLSGAQMWDQVDKLRVTELELRHLENPLQAQLKREEYNAYLRNLGIEPSRFQAIEENGDLVLVVKKLAHARLIWTRRQPDLARGVAVPIQDVDQLYSLFEIELPEDEKILFHRIRQFEFLERLIHLAERSKVEDIRSVKLDPIRFIDLVLDEGDPSKPRLVPEMHWDQMAASGRGTGAWTWWGGEDEEAMYRGRGNAWRAARGGAFAPAPGAGLGLQGRMTPTPTPSPQPIMGGTRIGHAVPLTVEFDATWENALEFLYAMSHNHNPFEIDKVRLQTIFGEGGKIRTEVTVVPMAWVEGLQAFYQPEGTTTTVATVSVTPSARTGAPPPSQQPAGSRFGAPIR